MREVTDEFDERLLIGELYLPIEKLVKYYGDKPGRGVHLPFNFHLLSTPWSAAQIYRLIAQYEQALPAEGWPNWVWGNHDNMRLRTRIGEKQLWNAAILLLTLRGTPTIYYGEEIGMADTTIAPNNVQDPREKNEPGIGLGRDPVRTPMQWSSEAQAGFSQVSPWLPINQNYKEVNVAAQMDNPGSLLHFYRRLIRLRQQEPALHRGDYIPAGIEGELMCYIREWEDTRFLICVNLGNEKVSFKPAFEWSGKVAVSNKMEMENSKIHGRIELDGGDGWVIHLD
jgi:alpha-glucosidase